MTTAQNKVRFGLKNVHYALLTELNGEITYSTPVKFPGAVELTLDPKGEQVEFYADNKKYYVATSNQGYEGAYTAAEPPESFIIDVLGEAILGGVIVETTDAKPKAVALMYEFDGDVKATRHVLYNVSFARPSQGGATKEESAEVATNEFSFVASEGPNGLVKAKTNSATPDEVYDAWYSTVYVPTAETATETPQG